MILFYIEGKIFLILFKIWLQESFCHLVIPSYFFKPMSWAWPPTHKWMSLRSFFVVFAIANLFFTTKYAQMPLQFCATLTWLSFNKIMLNLWTNRNWTKCFWPWNPNYPNLQNYINDWWFVVTCMRIMSDQSSFCFQKNFFRLRCS